MVQINNVDVLALQAVANAVPEAQPPAEPYADEPRASQVYENVQVLGDLSEGEFLRVMNAITEWVSPQEGCLYCHGENLASDDIYTKVVARRMIQMTRAINTDWTAHVQQTGVTCYTCHRGNPVPLQVWSEDPGPRTAGGMSARRNGQNGANPVSGLSSLPYDPFSALLRNPDDIRVISKAALPVRGQQGLGATIQETEKTYGLMIHMSEALGVNCTFCHNSALVLGVGPELAAALDRLVRHPHGGRRQRRLHRPAEAGVPGDPPRPARRSEEGQLRHLPSGGPEAAARRLDAAELRDVARRTGGGHPGGDAGTAGARHGTC